MKSIPDLLPNPHNAGSAEYRAIHELLAEPRLDLGTAIAICDEFNDWATSTRALLITAAGDAPPWNPPSHWDDHPQHHFSDWQLEVSNNETRQSYIAWVNSQIEQTDEESERSDN